MSERAFKIAVGGLVGLGALVGMVLGWEAWFAPVMDCLGYEA